MAEKNSMYSQKSAKKTMVFVFVLLGLAAAFAFLAVYMTYKQSTIMTQSTYFEKPTPTGSLKK